MQYWQGQEVKAKSIETASQNKLLHHEYNEEYGV